MSFTERPEIILAAINAKWIHPSLALRLLKANLGPLEEHCEVIEFALRQNLSEKLDAILAARPLILGLSVSIWNHRATLELLERLHSEFSKSAFNSPEAKPVVVLGGPEVSFLPESAEIFRYADYVIRGEGEIAFRKLCENIFNRNRVSVNSCGRSGSGTGSPVFINQDMAEPDPSEIKNAYRLYTDEDLARKLVYVESSRGCPFGCEFCLSSAGNSKPKVREFPTETFLSEMDSLILRGAKNFKFLDRSFNLNIERALRIMEFFLERINKSASPICVHFEMIPRNFPEELRNTIRRFPAGSLRIEIGIQTLNAACAGLIHRSGNTDEALEIAAFLVNETNAIVHADLIAGLPGEDRASFGKGFDILWTAMSRKEISQTGPATEIQLGILKLLPGASIARHSEKYGMRYETEAPYEVTESAAMPREEMDRIKNFARFWELIVNRGNYPSFVKDCLPAGKPVFNSFMDLSGELLKRFGRNWGIDRKEMTAALDELKDKYKSSGGNQNPAYHSLDG